MKCIKQRGIFMIPDFLCNAGGVTVSYFEGVQNDMNFYWTKEEVLEKLDTKMTQAFHSVLDMALQGKRLHARRGLHGGHRPRGQGHAAARLDLNRDHFTRIKQGVSIFNTPCFFTLMNRLLWVT